MNNIVEKTINSIDVSKITDRLNGDQILNVIESGMMLFGICYLAKVGGDFTLSFGDASLSYSGRNHI